MNTATLAISPLRKLRDVLAPAMRRPPRTQLAALCHRDGKSGPELLLITTRDTKRWIIPKGWPMANASARKTAQQEAFEEAGIIGEIGKKPIGEFSSHKGMGNGFKVRTKVVVFPLKVEDQVADFPEHGERELVWLPLEEAVGRCQDSGLREFLGTPAVKSLLMNRK